MFIQIVSGGFVSEGIKCGKKYPTLTNVNGKRLTGESGRFASVFFTHKRFWYKTLSLSESPKEFACICEYYCHQTLEGQVTQSISSLVVERSYGPKYKEYFYMICYCSMLSTEIPKI